MRSQKSYLSILFIALLGLSAVFCETETQSRNIAETIDLLGNTDTDESLSMLKELINQYGLHEYLQNTANLTIFAPINRAIRARGSIDKPIQEVLRYHIVPNKVIDASNSGSFIEDSALVATGANSDVVNLPKGMAQKLIVVSTGVPVPLSIYHGIPNPALTVAAAFPCSNGVVYLIDSYMMPPPVFPISFQAYGLEAFYNLSNSFDLLWWSNQSRMAGLTIFPSNVSESDFISKFPNGTALKNAVLYHYVAGVYYTTDLKDGMKLQTESGYNATVRIENNNIFIDGAKIVTPNVPTANGVMHIIDQHLDPWNNGSKPNAKPKLIIDNNTEMSDAQTNQLISMPMMIICALAGIISVFVCSL